MFASQIHFSQPIHGFRFGRLSPLVVVGLVLALLTTFAAATPPATRPGKLPFIDVDIAKGEVRVQCQAIRVDAPLEFLCVMAGGPEHEAVLRTGARPSHVHMALLMAGLEPGGPVSYSESTKKWMPPFGPPIRIDVEFEKDGKRVTLPSSALMRSVRDQKTMPRHDFIFAGSRVMDDGQYAADVTGYIVSLVNFDLTPIDVPQLASNANASLEWEIDPEVAPAAGTAVTMVLRRVAEGEVTPPAPAAGGLSDVRINRQDVDRLERLWQDKVAPHDSALREAAQAHYEVMGALRREQQRLIDEADRIQRVMDDLEDRYRHMTTPRPPATRPERE